MPLARGSENRSDTGKSSPKKRNSPRSSQTMKRTTADATADTATSTIQSLQLLTLSDALQDIAKNNASRKPSSGPTPLLPAAPTSSWVIDLTEFNERSLTPIQPLWSGSFPNFDNRLHRKWSGGWEPSPSSQTPDPTAGVLKNAIASDNLSSMERRTSLGVDGFSAITKVNTETNQGDGPMALLVRQNDNVGWDAATEVDSDSESVAADDDIPTTRDMDEIAVESVLGIKRASGDWEADEPSRPPSKRPRMDASLSSNPEFSSTIPPSSQDIDSSQGGDPASQASNLETQSSTQVEQTRPRKVLFGPDPDGHAHRTKAKSMSMQHRKKQAEKKRKALKAAAGPPDLLNKESSPLDLEIEYRRPTKEALRAKEAQHFMIRDRVYERVGELLELYEDRVLLNCGLDLREVRRQYTLQPWNPNTRKRFVQRADGAWRTLDGPEQWKLCTPALGEFVRIAYPPEDHPAWSIADRGAVTRWRESEEYVYRRTGECELGLDHSEVKSAGEPSGISGPLSDREDSPIIPELLNIYGVPSEDAARVDAFNHTQVSRQPPKANGPRRRSTRSSTPAALSSSQPPPRITRSTTVAALPPTVLRRHSSDSLSSRPMRNTRSRARARTIAPLPQTHTRRLRSAAPSA
ncbi:hypothetical protein FS837_009310 [Tulasnella sp. UAMH 9824]|nr:hypothetical protein FS837_009310 [Tulasnella sp. UAMH 9824]